MSYRSEVFAAVVDSKTRLEVLIEGMKGFFSLEEREIFDEFKLVHLEKDIWAFVFYDPNIRWYEEAQHVWQVTAKQAKIFNCSYIFYRLGDDYTDTEVKEYAPERAKNYRYLLEAATLQRTLILDKRMRSAFDVKQY